ncbi:hypothetical protein N9L68_05655 [bacterium]|nr:hypothetical protein [bacterium]
MVVGAPSRGAVQLWTTALARRIYPHFHDDILAAEAVLLTCRLEGSWLEIFDRHYLIPLVRSWNRLQQKLYCALYLCFHGWRGLAEQSQAVADDPGAVFEAGVQLGLEVEDTLRLDRLD